MDNVAAEILRQQLWSRKGTAFQEALDKIFSIIHGDNFTQIKQKKDQGCDGILQGSVVLAAYAPERPNLPAFKKKIGDDFEGYKNNWAATHPKWTVVCNDEITAAMLKHVKDLKPDASTISLDGLVDEIKKQNWSKKNLIFKALGIPDHYLSNDVFGTIVEDLIKTSEDKVSQVPYSHPTYIDKKIELNLEIEHKDSFSDEYFENLDKFSLIQAVVGSHTPETIFSLRAKIRSEYQSLSGSFSERLSVMTDRLCSNKKNDDYYRGSVRVLLIYFFEQCLFGRKTEQEAS